MQSADTPCRTFDRFIRRASPFLRNWHGHYREGVMRASPRLKLHSSRCEMVWRALACYTSSCRSLRKLGQIVRDTFDARNSAITTWPSAFSVANRLHGVSFFLSVGYSGTCTTSWVMRFVCGAFTKLKPARSWWWSPGRNGRKTETKPSYQIRPQG